MKKLYFGLPALQHYSEEESMRITSMLFLNPFITTEHVKLLLPALESGRLTLESFVERMNQGLNEIACWNSSVTDLHTVMRNKLNDWNASFRAPKEKDYLYIEKTYGYSKEFLLGNMTNEEQKLRISSPKDMADYVKQYIKGQDHAIEQLAVPFFLQRDSKLKQYTCAIKVPTILMGPTGVGKSEILRLYGKICGCPVIRINTSDIVPTSWKGLHLTDILAREITAGRSIKELEYAVIIIHEFDKITHYGQRNNSGTSDTYDVDMMKDIMGLFDTEHNLYLDTGFDKESMGSKIYKLPVDNLLVLFDGAFHGIERIISKRLDIAPHIGFSQKENTKYDGINLQSFVTEKDLEEWGYSPELLGRVGNIVVMNPLSVDVIYQIMTSAKGNVLSSHIDFCKKNNIDLRFSKEALIYMAEKIQKAGLGFRKVKALLSNAMWRLLYESLAEETGANKKVIEISKDYLVRNLSM